MTITLDQYKADLAEREAQIRAELATATPENRPLLQAEAAELARKNADLEGSLKAAQTLISDLKASLGNAETDDAKAAQTALDNGDLDTARDIFERIQARAAPEIETAAKAAYALGQIAKEQVRWHDAAAHYAKAAQLNPTYQHLYAAREFAWRAGDYPTALRFGPDLLEAAKAEFAEISAEFATALNEHALTLRATGRTTEAETLFCQALNIGEKTIGLEHPNYATRLNNFAGLLRDTGRTSEAEPLYRQAMDITKKTLGVEHPAFAIRLNNLANLLRDTGRTDEAEPLYRQAMDITKKTLGVEHQAYATRLRNLSVLYEKTERLSEAAPLAEQAKHIFEKALGTDHPKTKGATEAHARIQEKLKASTKG